MIYYIFHGHLTYLYTYSNIIDSNLSTSVNIYWVLIELTIL